MNETDEFIKESNEDSLSKVSIYSGKSCFSTTSNKTLSPESKSVSMLSNSPPSSAEFLSIVDERSVISLISSESLSFKGESHQHLM